MMGDFSYKEYLKWRGYKFNPEKKRMEIPTHKYKKSRVHKEYNDESIYNMYIQLYRSGIKNNRDSKYLNAIQKKIIDYYKKIVPEPLRCQPFNDNQYRFIDTLKPHKDKTTEKDNITDVDRSIRGEIKVGRHCVYDILDKQKQLEEPISFKPYFIGFLFPRYFEIEHDLNEHYLKRDNHNIELMKQTETYEKPAYEEAIEDFYDI